MLWLAGATEAPPGELELELAAMQACYVQLKHLVPTVPLNVELSSLQLLQHVIDYIVDLELALHSSASSLRSSPWQPPRHQHQHPNSSPRHSMSTHSNDRLSLSTSSSPDELRNSSSPSGTDHASPQSASTLPTIRRDTCSSGHD